MLGLGGELEEYVGKLHSGADSLSQCQVGESIADRETACDRGATIRSASCQHATVVAVGEE